MPSVTCLSRATAIQKSSRAPAGERPDVQTQIASLDVDTTALPLLSFEEIVLVDDVVTQGCTLLGAASRMHEVFPDAKITAFAMGRAVFPDVFRSVRDPVVGTITFNPANGRAIREP